MSADPIESEEMVGQLRLFSDERLIARCIFKIDQQRVNSVVLKLARGHAAYELSEPQYDYPTRILVVPFPELSKEARAEFEAGPVSAGVVGWPEVGSRAFQRLALAFGGT